MRQPGRAIALLILDAAGWHSSPQVVVPENIVLLPLPPYAPELNPAENIWEYLRGNALSNCVWETYEAILRRLLRCLERSNGKIQRHHLNRNQRMGTGQDLRRLDQMWTSDNRGRRLICR